MKPRRESIEILTGTVEDTGKTVYKKYEGIETAVKVYLLDDE